MLKNIYAITLMIGLLGSGCASKQKTDSKSSAKAEEVPALNVERRADESEDEFRVRKESREAFRAGVIEVKKNIKSNKATSLFKKAVKTDPSFGWPAYNLGVQAQHAGQTTVAIQYYQAALKADPKIDPAIRNLGLLLGQTSSETELARFYRSALSNAPESAWARVGLAELARNNDNQKKSMELAREALKYNAKLVPAYEVLAVGYADAKKNSLARLYALRGQQLDVNNIELDYALAKVLLLENDVSAGRALLKRILSKEPNHEGARKAFLAIVTKRKDWAGVAAQLKEISELGVRDAALFNNLGVALKGQGRFGDAQKAYEKALSIDAGFEEAQWNLGLLALQQLKDADKAKTAFNAYARLNPKGYRAVSPWVKKADDLKKSQMEEERMLREMEAEEKRMEAEAQKEAAEAKRRAAEGPSPEEIAAEKQRQAEEEARIAAAKKKAAAKARARR